MNPRLANRLVRLGYAAATGAGIGSLIFWVIYWFSFIRGSLRGPDFFNFYAAAKLYVTAGGTAVYDVAMQRQVELQITGADPSRFIVLPYFHPPYYTLLIAPLAYLDYRNAYYVMAAANALLAAALVVILVRTSLKVHGRGWLVAAAMIGGFFPLFVTVLQGQSDLVVLVPLAAAYAAWAQGRHATAGALSALALAKPQLLLLIPVLFIALSLSWRPDKPRLDFAVAIAASLVLSPHQNIHDLALLVIPGFALADLALAGRLRWPHVAVGVLFFAYAAIDLTLAINFWAAAVGALAVAGYLTIERMAVRPDPIPLGELQWSGPRPRRVIVLPAYRAAKTLVEVVGDIPQGHADRILLVDDASADATVSVATALRLDVIRHQRNLGYGGNQKTCYRQALEMGADVVVMLHPDGQYDPAIIPNLCRVVEDGDADIVLGSRWLGLDPAKAGMPWWKRLGNRFLTASENRVLGLRLSEYHTGYRAYSRRFLETIPFLENSNDFVFDTQVLIQAATFGFKIGEVPAIGRYHDDASSVSFKTSTVYGLKTLGALMQYVLHRAGFPCVWLTPVSDADKESLAISQVAHHSQA